MASTAHEGTSFPVNSVIAQSSLDTSHGVGLKRVLHDLTRVKSTQASLTGGYWRLRQELLVDR